MKKPTAFAAGHMRIHIPKLDIFNEQWKQPKVKQPN